MFICFYFIFLSIKCISVFINLKSQFININKPRPSQEHHREKKGKKIHNFYSNYGMTIFKNKEWNNIQLQVSSINLKYFQTVEYKCLIINEKHNMKLLSNNFKAYLLI